MISPNVSSRKSDGKSLPGAGRSLQTCSGYYSGRDMAIRQCLRQKQKIPPAVIVVVNKPTVALIACSVSGLRNQHWLHQISRVSERAKEGGKGRGRCCWCAVPIRHADAVLIARQQTHDRVPCAPLHSLRRGGHLPCERPCPVCSTEEQTRPINVLISYTCVRNACPLLFHPCIQPIRTLLPFNSAKPRLFRRQVHDCSCLSCDAIVGIQCRS